MKNFYNEQFPPELLSNIFCFLEVDDLKQSQLVCKAWCHPAITRSYHRITVRENSKFENLIQCLSLFGKLVQHIHFDLLPTLLNDETKFKLKQRYLHRIFRRCPNVQHISSNKETEHLVLKTLYSFRKSIGLTNLATIPRMCFASNSFYRKCILAHWESITEFCIESRSQLGNRSIGGFSEQLPTLPRLEFLQITKEIISMDDIACILKYYTQLKYLSLQVNNLESLPRIVPAFPTLKALQVAIPTDADFSFDDLNRFLSHVPHLESLDITVNNTTGSILSTSGKLYGLSLAIDRLWHLKEARLISRCPVVSMDTFAEAIDYAYINCLSKQMAHPDPGWSTDISFLIDGNSIQGNSNLRDSISYSMSRNSKQQCVQLRAPSVYARESQINSYIKSFAHVATSLHVDFQVAFDGLYDLGYLFPLLQEFKEMKKLTLVGGHYNDPLPGQVSVPSVHELCLKNFDCSASNSVYNICTIFSNLESLSLQFNIHCKSMLSPKLVHMPEAHFKKVYIDIIDFTEERLPGITDFNNYATKNPTYNISLRLAKTNLHFRYHATSKPFIELIRNPTPSSKDDIFDLSMEFHDVEAFLFRYDGSIQFSWCE